VGLVVDTSAVVDLERAPETPLTVALGPLADEPVVMPAIVLAELLVGVGLAPSARVAAQRRAKVEAVRNRVPVVPFDAIVAERWADVAVLLARRGAQIPSSDLAVAATALSLAFGVLVGRRGEEHLGRIPGLRVVRLAL
jgi:predicted nucleic acid-binding protein